MTSIGEDVEKWLPQILLVECETVQPIWRTVWQFLKKLTIVPTRPSNSTPKYITKRNENIYIPTKTCTGMFTTVLFILASRWKQHKCPSTDEWINQVRNTEYSSAIKRNEVLIRATT